MNSMNDHLPISPDDYIHVPDVRCVYGDCPCDRSRCCDIWMEFQIAMVSLHDSEELTHGNWREITRLRNYIDYLEDLLERNGIGHSSEFDAPGQPDETRNRKP